VEKISLLSLTTGLSCFAPFTPHICEELWHLKHSSYVSLERYPEYEESRIDEEAEMIEEYLRNLVEDIQEIKKFVSDAREVYISPSRGVEVQGRKGDSGEQGYEPGDENSDAG